MDRSWRPGGGVRRLRIGRASPAWPALRMKRSRGSRKARDFLRPRIPGPHEAFYSRTRSVGSWPTTRSEPWRIQRSFSARPHPKIRWAASWTGRHRGHRPFFDWRPKTPFANSFTFIFFRKKRIFHANQLTGYGAVTIMGRAEEIHSAKAHVFDRRRSVKRGH